MKFNRMYNGATEYCRSCGNLAAVKVLYGDTIICNNCLFQWRRGEAYHDGKWLHKELGWWFRRGNGEWEPVPYGCLWILMEKRVCRTKARCVG